MQLFEQMKKEGVKLNASQTFNLEKGISNYITDLANLFILIKQINSVELKARIAEEYGSMAQEFIDSIKLVNEDVLINKILFNHLRKHIKTDTDKNLISFFQTFSECIDNARKKAILLDEELSDADKELMISQLHLAAKVFFDVMQEVR